MLVEKTFTHWFCERIKELRLRDDEGVIVFPFRPLGDDPLRIFLRFDGEYVRISDDGETLAQLFVSYGFDDKEFIRAQREFIKEVCEFHEVSFEDGEFFLKVPKRKKQIFEKVMEFVQATLPLYHVIMIQGAMQEKTFSRQVFKTIKDEIPGLEPEKYFEFYTAKVTTTRKIDLFRENEAYFIGRAIRRKQSVSSAFLTWSYLNKFQHYEWQCRSLRPSKRIFKIAIYSEKKLSEEDVIPLKWGEGMVFSFESQRDKIIKTFLGQVKEKVGKHSGL